MSRGALWIALLAVVACTDDPNQSGLVYYPLIVGSQWNYRISGVKQLEGKRIQSRAARKEMVGLTECTVIEGWMDGKLLATEHMSATPKGIFRHSFDNERITPPICLLKFPFKPGARWEKEYLTTDYGKVTFSVDTVEESITIPYGPMTAYRSTVRVLKNGRQIASSTYWFSKGKGIVKQDVNMPGLKLTLDLETYDLGIPR